MVWWDGYRMVTIAVSCPLFPLGDIQDRRPVATCGLEISAKEVWMYLLSAEEKEDV